MDLQSDDAPGVGIRNGGDMAWCLTEEEDTTGLRTSVSQLASCQRGNRSMYQTIINIRDQCQEVVRSVVVYVSNKE